MTRSLLAVAAFASLAASFPRMPAAAARADVTIRLSVDEDPIVPHLAAKLGYLKDAGVVIVPVAVESFAKEDYLLQKPLRDGKIDAAYHWFNHAVFGARHGLPVQGVMVFNDAPAMTVMVAKREAATITSAADFRGKNVAEGAPYGTKAVITNYLARRAGVPTDGYRPVDFMETGRERAVIADLRAHKIDVLTFQEPITSDVQATGLVSTLYDLNSGPSTAKVLGAPWPAQSLLMAPSFIAAHPDRAQRLVTAFVRTMRWINAHTTRQIVDELAPEYFVGKDRAATVHYLERTIPAMAKNDYRFSPKSVRLVVDTMSNYAFDTSEEGTWRATGSHRVVDPSTLYTNRFVDEAMREVP